MPKKVASSQKVEEKKNKLSKIISTDAIEQKKRRIFFQTIDQLQAKKRRYEDKLKGLVGIKYRRKRANTLKIIMQINRAMKAPENYVKDPKELERRRQKDRIRRIAKKLERRRIKQIKQDLREDAIKPTYDR